MFPLFLLNRGGVGDPIKRCRKCGEPINRTGKLLEEYPNLVFILSTLLGGVVFTFCLVTVSNWAIAPPERTLVQQFSHSFSVIWHGLTHLW